jgi:hypothetical protein
MSTQEKLANDGSLSQSAGTGRTVTAEAVDRLIEQAEYKQHRYGQAWQRLDLPTFQELVGNIDRRGLDQEILLYQGMILEGWSRYLACLATKTQPRFVEFRGTDLEAAERVHASGIRRQSSAEQRYASFLLLCERCPAFGAKYEALKQKGAQQQQAGTPLSTERQRVDVLGAKAAAEGVSRSTAAKVEAAAKRNPGAVARIATGETTANEELGKTEGKARPARKKGTPREAPTVGAEGQRWRHRIGVLTSLPVEKFLDSLRHFNASLDAMQFQITPASLKEMTELLETVKAKLPRGRGRKGSR